MDLVCMTLQRLPAGYNCKAFLPLFQALFVILSALHHHMCTYTFCATCCALLDLAVCARVCNRLRQKSYAVMVFMSFKLERWASCSYCGQSSTLIRSYLWDLLLAGCCSTPIELMNTIIKSVSFNDFVCDTFTIYALHPLSSDL